MQDILTESFDPIMELTTGADLMMAMVYAQELGDWDYSGMYTAVLKFKVRLSEPSMDSLSKGLYPALSMQTCSAHAHISLHNIRWFCQLWQMEVNSSMGFQCHWPCSHVLWSLCVIHTRGCAWALARVQGDGFS